MGEATSGISSTELRKHLFYETSHSPSLADLVGYEKAKDIIDFCFIANPYYPTPAMLQDLEENFPNLIKSYPSSSPIRSQKDLAAVLHVNPENLIIGNGASELIVLINTTLIDRIAVPIPTFGEYIEKLKDQRDAELYVLKPEENYKHLEKTHPLKDEIEIRLIRHALRKKLPILGICRGSQLLNVVCGGTLYGDVQKAKKSRLKHINFAHYDSYRHRISIVPGSPLQEWYRRKTLRVNSYHHQGIQVLAPRFKPMAYAKDGLVEGYYDPKTDFLVGLQFHPERMLEQPVGNWRVWKAFGSAIHRKPPK